MRSCKRANSEGGSVNSCVHFLIDAVNPVRFMEKLRKAAVWVFLAKTRKLILWPRLEISVTFRDQWSFWSFFNAIWRGGWRLHRGPDGRRKDLSDMRVFPPRETTQIVDILPFLNKRDSFHQG